MKVLVPVVSYLSLYLAFLVFCCVSGMALVSVLARWLDRGSLSMPNLSTALFVYVGTGISLVICALFLLAALGFLQPLGLVLLGFSIMAAALALLPRRPIELRAACGISAVGNGEWIWGIPLVVYGTGLLLGALRPPFAWDELSYHLPYARDYAEAGGLTLNEFLRYPLHSHNFNLLFSLALTVSDERLAHLFHGGAGLLTALGLFGTAHRFLGVGGAVIAVLALFSFDGFRHIIPTAHVDLGLSLFVTLGAVSLLHWHDTGRRSWLYVAALATGMAMGTKYIGALFAPLFGLWVVIRSRSLRETLAFTLVVTLFGVWWYVRSYAIAGNPVHPFAGDLFGYFLWDARDLAAQHDDLASYIAGTGLLAPFRAAVTLAFGERPELSALALPFFAAPLLYRRFHRALRALLAVVLSYYLVWSWFLGPPRYLMPIMPAMALFSAAVLTTGFGALAALPKIRPLAGLFAPRRHKLLPVLVALLLIVAAQQAYDLMAKIPTWPWSRAAEVDFMTRRYPGYALMRAANESPELDGAPLYLMGFGNLMYWYRGQVIGDYFGIARYRQVIAEDPVTGERAPDPKKLMALAERFGIHGVLVESAAFPRLDLRRWQQHFDLLARTEQGTLWHVAGREER